MAQSLFRKKKIEKFPVFWGTSDCGTTPKHSCRAATGYKYRIKVEADLEKSFCQLRAHHYILLWPKSLSLGLVHGAGFFFFRLMFNFSNCKFSPIIRLKKTNKTFKSLSTAQQKDLLKYRVDRSQIMQYGIINIQV